MEGEYQQRLNAHAQIVHKICPNTMGSWSESLSLNHVFNHLGLALNNPSFHYTTL